MNVTLQPNTPLDLYAATGIAVGVQLVLSLNTTQVVRLAETEQGLTDDFITLHQYKQASNENGAVGAWVSCHRAAVINVREA